MDSRTFLVVPVPPTLGGIVMIDPDSGIDPTMAALLAVTAAYQQCNTPSKRKHFLWMAGYHDAKLVEVR